MPLYIKIFCGILCSYSKSHYEQSRLAALNIRWLSITLVISDQSSVTMCTESCAAVELNCHRTASIQYTALSRGMPWWRPETSSHFAITNRSSIGIKFQLLLLLIISTMTVRGMPRTSSCILSAHETASSQHDVLQPSSLSRVVSAEQSQPSSRRAFAPEQFIAEQSQPSTYGRRVTSEQSGRQPKQSPTRSDQFLFPGWLSVRPSVGHWILFHLHSLSNGLVSNWLFQDY